MFENEVSCDGCRRNDYNFVDEERSRHGSLSIHEKTKKVNHGQQIKTHKQLVCSFFKRVKNGENYDHQGEPHDKIHCVVMAYKSRKTGFFFCFSLKKDHIKDHLHVLKD